MDKRLVAKRDEVTAYAQEHGWLVHSAQSRGIEGCIDAVMIGGVRVDRHPEADAGVEFLFTLAFGVNERTGRVVVLQHAEQSDAPFVIEVEDLGRYWYGPLRCWKAALADPVAWTGVVVPGPGGAQ